MVFPRLTSVVFRLLLSGSVLLLAGQAGLAVETGSFESLRAEGEKAFSQNNYGVAEKNFVGALKYCETEKVALSDLRWSLAYKNLSSLYEVRGQFPKAELYLEKELRSLEKALGAENPRVIALVGKLTRFYIAHSSVSKAHRLTTLLMAYGERSMKQERDVDAHLAQVAKYFGARDEYKEAEKKLKNLTETTAKIRADDHLELAASLDSIASLYKDKNEVDLAESLYKRAIDLREHALAPGHMALSFGYEHLATLYAAQGKTELAQPLFKKSLDIASKSLDFKRPEVFTRVDSLAKSYINQGQYAEAESLYRQALSLIKEHCGGQHRDIASASFSLALLYIKQSRYSEATPLLKTALSISENMNGPQSASLVPVLDAYAVALEKGNSSSEAAKIRLRANTIKGNASACNTTASSAANF